jgi:biotin operon repressor
MKNNYCIGCGKSLLEKDTLALNKKFFGKNLEKFYCMECLANYLEVSISELYDKIEELKEQGCTLFV